MEKIIDIAEEAGIDIDNDVLEDWVKGELEDDDEDELDDVREVAELLTPDYLDQDNNGYDDRGEQLHEMVVNSGEVYNWGWSGFWWGWSGFWQSADDLNEDGFWQNFSFQTIEVSTNTLESINES